MCSVCVYVVAGGRCGGSEVARWGGECVVWCVCRGGVTVVVLPHQMSPSQPVRMVEAGAVLTDTSTEMITYCFTLWAGGQAASQQRPASTLRLSVGEIGDGEKPGPRLSSRVHAILHAERRCYSRVTA